MLKHPVSFLSSDLSLSSVSSGHAAEDHAVGNRYRSETHHAVDAARDFAGSIKSGDHVEIGIDHLRLRIDGEAAHAVVNSRPEAAGIEDAFVFLRVPEDLRVEVGILLRSNRDFARMD